MLLSEYKVISKPVAFVFIEMVICGCFFGHGFLVTRQTNWDLSALNAQQADKSQKGQRKNYGAYGKHISYAVMFWKIYLKNLKSCKSKLHSVMHHKYLHHLLGAQNMCWLLLVLFGNMRCYSSTVVVSLMDISWSH